MCIVNKNCNNSDGTCTCMRSFCESRKSSPLVVFLSQQTEMLQKIMEQNYHLMQELSTLTTSVCQSESPQQTCCTFNSEGFTSPEVLLQVLTGQTTEFELEIQLTSDFPKPTYKERAFQIDCRLFDKNGQIKSTPNPIMYNLLLFTEEYPPKLLKHNTSGDKIMKGTIQIETQDVLSFDKVIIKEVSSHFRNGKLFLVVAPDNAPHIKPLIIPDVLVKARKIKSDEPSSRKKRKINEN